MTEPHALSDNLGHFDHDHRPGARPVSSTGAIAGIVSERNPRNQDVLAKIKELSARDIAASCNKKTILAHLKSFVRLFLS